MMNTALLRWTRVAPGHYTSTDGRYVARHAYGENLNRPNGWHLMIAGEYADTVRTLAEAKANAEHDAAECVCDSTHFGPGEHLAECPVALAETLPEPVAGVFLRADELALGDLIVDEHGERKFAAFDIARPDDRVRVWPAQTDIDNGWPRDGLTFEPGDTLLVVRR